MENASLILGLVLGRGACWHTKRIILSPYDKRPGSLEWGTEVINVPRMRITNVTVAALTIVAWTLEWIPLHCSRERIFNEREVGSMIE